MFKHNFLVLSLTERTSTKDSKKYMVVKLFSEGLSHDVYVPTDKMELFKDVKPETRLEIEFTLRNAYNSNDLQIVIENVAKKNNL